MLDGISMEKYAIERSINFLNNNNNTNKHNWFRLNQKISSRLSLSILSCRHWSLEANGPSSS